MASYTTECCVSMINDPALSINYWPNISVNDPDPGSGSNFFSLNRDQDRLQKYWAKVGKKCQQKFKRTLTFVT